MFDYCWKPGLGPAWVTQWESHYHDGAGQGVGFRLGWAEPYMAGCSLDMPAIERRDAIQRDLVRKMFFLSPLSFFLAQNSLCKAFLVIRFAYCELSIRVSDGCHRTTVLLLMIVKISRSRRSSLFQMCGLKELTTAKGNNACVWQWRHHSLPACLSGQVCHTNREKKKKPREMGNKRPSIN